MNLQEQNYFSIIRKIQRKDRFYPISHQNNFFIFDGVSFTIIEIDETTYKLLEVENEQIILDKIINLILTNKKINEEKYAFIL